MRSKRSKRWKMFGFCCFIDFLWQDAYSTLYPFKFWNMVNAPSIFIRRKAVSGNASSYESVSGPASTTNSQFLMSLSLYRIQCNLLNRITGSGLLLPGWVNASRYQKDLQLQLPAVCYDNLISDNDKIYVI